MDKSASRTGGGVPRSRQAAGCGVGVPGRRSVRVEVLDFSAVPPDRMRGDPKYFHRVHSLSCTTSSHQGHSWRHVRVPETNRGVWKGCGMCAMRMGRRLIEAVWPREREARRNRAECFRSWLSRLRSTKTYGRAKRWIWQASQATVVAVASGLVLAWLLRGR